jgi:hypothetical protein
MAGSWRHHYPVSKALVEETGSGDMKETGVENGVRQLADKFYPLE